MPAQPRLYGEGVKSLLETVRTHVESAAHKADGSARVVPYFIAAMLAGAFIGLADIFMFTAAGPLAEAGSPIAPFMQGAVFGIGLILVMFAGGELATSAMMILPIGMIRKRIGAGPALRAFVLMIVGNFVGAMVIAALVAGSGIMHSGKPAGDFLAHVATGKVTYPSSELFFRAVLCNILVCLAIWVTGRITSEGAKALVMAWCMAAFVTSGFEHVVANMTTLWLGVFHHVPAVTAAGMGRNLGIVLLGNIVGGLVFVALPYLFAARTEEH